MADAPEDGGSSRPTSPGARLLAVFVPPAGTGPRADPERILPPEERKAAMQRLDTNEAKWSLGALVLATIAGVVLPAYLIASNKVTKTGKNSIAVAPDAALLGGAILLFCVVGYVALWKQRRTLVAFSLFLIGFGFTLFVGLVGFVFIFLGGWLMLRAWRLNRYGTTNARQLAKEAAARPKGGRGTRDASKGTAKKSGPEGARKPPTASKRYTPKSPPRKKIPKPAE